MNQVIFYYLNNFAGRSVCFDGLIIFFSQYFAYILVAVFVIIVLLNKKENKERTKIFALAAISTILSRGVITEIVRYFYYIPRPFVNNAVHQLIFHETNGSFPSGHAAFFFALAMAIFFFHKKWGTIFFIGAVLISVARVMVGIHWPLDILGGAIIGILSSLLIYKIFKISYNQE